MDVADRRAALRRGGMGGLDLVGEAMTPKDQRPVGVRAEAAVWESELESEGLTLTHCPCGTAELEIIPNRDRGFRCAGCKRVVHE